MQTKSGIKVGVAVPQAFPDGKVDIGLVHEYARRAEQAGFDELWTTEQITGSFPVLEPVTLLSHVAAVTSSIRLGTAMIISTLRNPVQLAKSIATLDQLSGGRFTMGIALGPTTRTYPTFGLSEERRVARFLEGVRVMKALWTQESATLDGDFWKLDGVHMEPKPNQQPHPPLWFGARSEAAMRRAVRMADGWMGSGSDSLEDFFEELSQIRAMVKEHGREGSFPISKRIYISVNDNEEVARQQVQDWLTGYYGARGEGSAPSWGVYGSAGRCLETLHRMRDAGMTHIMLHPAPTSLENLEKLATQIAPEV